MAKYYIQSGTVRTIVSADDPQKAALWTVHRAMQQIVPVYEDIELSPQEKSDVAVAQGMMVLGNSVAISELGFDRADAAQLDTFELVVEWHQLMVALARLEELMGPNASDK